MGTSRPTVTQLLAYYVTKLGGLVGWTTQEAARAALCVYFQGNGASGELPLTTLTAPGRMCGGVFQHATTTAWYAWATPTTTKRLEYIEDYF